MSNPTWAAPGSRLVFRQVEESDAETITRWRNSSSARAGFFTSDVVTPDTHRAFVRNRRPHDLVWIVTVVSTGQPIGMKALTVEAHNRSAESGRTYIDEGAQGHGYSLEQEFCMLWYAFEVLRLDWIWGEVLANNDALNAMMTRMGWQLIGIDVAGHAHPAAGPVEYIEYHANDWAAKRDDLWKMVVRKWRPLGETAISAPAEFHLASVG